MKQFVSHAIPRRGMCLLTGMLAGISFLAVVSCAGVKEPPPVRYYVLERPEPSQTLPAVFPRDPAAVTVLRFSASEACLSRSMAYRDGPFRSGSYHYHRWQNSPAEMITEFITADLLKSGLFKAVFSDYGYERSRFVLEGRVLECFELIDGEREVKVGLSATFIDNDQPVAKQRILFQNTYRQVRPVEDDGAPGTAAAMSRSVAELSDRLLEDIAGAIATHDAVP